MSSDAHARARAHAHARTHAHTQTHMHAHTRAHSRTISAGQEYELPYSLKKDAGDEEDAWAIKDGNGRTVLKLIYKLHLDMAPPVSVPRLGAEGAAAFPGTGVSACPDCLFSL